MSVYIPQRTCKATGRKIARTRIYQADVVLKGPSGKSHRIRRSTGQTTKRSAQAVVAEWRRRAPLGQLDWLIENDGSDLLLGEACVRYWQEVAQHRRSAKNIATNLEHCQRLLGADTPLIAIDGNRIAQAAAARAGEAHPTRPGTLISLTTANRQIIETMRAIHRRAARVWKPRGLPDIDWRELKYDEGEGRTRTLTDTERDIFWREVRDDYAPILWFNFNRGRRLCEMNPERDDVDLERGLISFRVAKRDGQHRRETMELLPDELALVRAEWARAPGRKLFHYQVQRGPQKGMWKPITYHGLKTYLRRLLARLRAEHPGHFEDLRIHDFRHDFATNLLKDSRNLKWVQVALAHKDIASTMRYAHVVGHADVTEAIGKARQGTAPAAIKTPNYPRTG